MTKVTRNGHITIPIEIRKSHGIEEGDLIHLYEQDGQIILESSSDWVSRMSGRLSHFAKGRSGTDQAWDAAIGEAVSTEYLESNEQKW